MAARAQRNQSFHLGLFASQTDLKGTYTVRYRLVHLCEREIALGSVDRPTRTQTSCLKVY